ncbi:hypothetical protein EJ419_02375 [Alloscardovia theropitheci]|uniref:Cell division protein n=1 Tax=Alloscardovia theropitheci TaxID=2496842 RepID=A0A4R0QYJ1_9BIFI|nr:hypothetical protein [Alloscardovia theropitheci]TCD54701.1 hypothetical protein EJ419_02375 [Alloscardovia theropitheci]
MAEAFEYNPDEQFDDDSTGSAEVARANADNLDAIPGVDDAQLAVAQSQSQVNNAVFSRDVYVESAESNHTNGDLSGDTSDSESVDSDVVEVENLVDPQTQAAINAFIPEAEDITMTSSTEDQFTTAYDIIDQIEEIVEEAPQLFFSRSQVRINHAELSDLLMELKDVLPVQLERASALMREAEKRLENAQSQADAIVNNAQAKATSIINDANTQAHILAGQENVVSLATEQARNILNTAQEKANALTQGANNYTADSMRALDDQLVELRHSINTGLQVLKERQQMALQDLPHLTPEDYPQN